MSKATQTRNLQAAALLAAALFLGPSVLGAAQSQNDASKTDSGYLTPVEAKFSVDGTRLYVVCEDADALLVVDTGTKKVVGRVPVGHRPKDVAQSPDGQKLYVSNEWSDSVTEIDAKTLKVARTIPAGWGPVGLTTDRTGQTLYVANSIGSDVSVIELATGTEKKRLASWRSPHNVLLSRDGRYVFVSNMLGHLGPWDQTPVSELTIIDANRQIIAQRLQVPGVIELRHIAEGPAAEGEDLIIPFMRPKNLNPLIQVSNGWILTHGVLVLHPSSAAKGGYEVSQVLLDDIDEYYAGANGVAFTPDGKRILVTAAEANIVSVIDTAKLKQRIKAVPPDQLPNRLDSAATFVQRRLETGAEPMAVAVSKQGDRAYVVNRLDDSLTVINLATTRVEGRIDLGGPKEETTLRRGEKLFHSAKFCFQGQFACVTCHPDNHIDGVSWNLETPELGKDRVANRTLRGIAETAPYKWNGHNPDLETQCGPRIAKFLFHSEGFNKEELGDLVAFIKSIPLAPNRHLAADGQLTLSQERGKKIFFQKNCDNCHPPATHYTALRSFDVGTANKYDTSGLLDVPQLDRIYEKPPYLHNGEALTLEEIWTVFNGEDKHGVTSDMSKEQLNDLIEFLKTL
ncbi:MAG TPA: YncE family protein [Candidatus Saccharimonadales bacterium]|nr:YncE family protein [Candidatus Saccharimonadales bacterium]